MERTTISELTDEELIELIVKEGNRDYFSVLFERYKDRVRGKCYSMTKSKEISEDLLQDIMMKALEKLDTFKGKSSFSTWLYSVAYNHIIEYLRANKRIKYEDWADSIELPDEVREEDVEDVLELKTEQVTLLLEMLKPEDKALVLLKYKEGFDLKKIMYILSLDGESATKMRLNRAKKRLVGLFNQFYPALDE